MTDLHYLTIADAAARMRSGDVTSAELVEASLERISTPHDTLNAVLTLLADEARAATSGAILQFVEGRSEGPLDSL